MSDSVPAHDVRLLLGGDGVVSRCSSTGTGTGEIGRERVGETYGGGEEGRVRSVWIGAVTVAVVVAMMIYKERLGPEEAR